MILKNLTRKTVISKYLKELTTYSDKNSGLLDSKNGKEVMFKTRFGIHTFFLKESIDVLILDNNQKVVKVCQNLKPFRVLFWNPTFDTVIEVPSGTIQKSSTSLGDKLSLL